MPYIRPAAALLPLSLLLTACGSAEEEAVNPNISSAGPGELIVPEDDAAGVPVDLPEATMTPLPGAPEDTNVETTTTVVQH